MTATEQTTINTMKLKQVTMQQDIKYMQSDINEIKGDIKEIKGILTAKSIADIEKAKSDDEKYISKKFARWIVSSVLIPIAIGAMTLYLYIKDHVKS